MGHRSKRGGLGGAFFNLLLIVSLVLFFLTYTQSGAISVTHAAFGLVLLTIFMALGRAFGWGLVQTTFRIAPALAAVAAFAVWRGDGNPQQALSIAGGVFAIVIVLFGIYVMLGGMRN